MNRTLSIFTAAGLLLCPLTGFAASAAKSESAKIGFVNVRTCFEKQKEGLQARENIKDLDQEMNQTLEQIDKKIDDVSDQLDNEDLRDSRTAEATKELQEKQKTLYQEREGKYVEFSQQMKQRQMATMQQIFEKIGAASQAVAKQLGLSAVLSEESALFYNPDLEITEQVIKLMDKGFETSGSANSSQKANRDK